MIRLSVCIRRNKTGNNKANDQRFKILHGRIKIMEKRRGTLIIVPSYQRYLGGQPGYSPVATTWAAGFYPCPVRRTNRCCRYI
jgi:hypothetical protein